MLLLLTIALVLVAAITLLIGIISDTLPLIFVSILCSFGAGVTLLLLSRASKNRAREGAGTGDAASATPAAAATADEPTTVMPAAPAPEVAAVAAAAPVAAPVTPSAAADADPDFPIEDYDSLRVAEILPLLDDMDLDELDMVLEREENGKNRATLVNRLNQRMDQLEAEEEAAAAPPTEVLEPAAVAGPQPQAVGAAPPGGDFPIADYDDMRVSEVLPLLLELDDEELEMVYEREDAGAARATILNRIDEILDEREAGDSAFAPAAAPAPAAKKGPAKKTAAKATVKKAPAKKAAAKKAPAITATPVKRTAKKAPTVRVAKVSGATAKKATAAKKTTAKKAATGARKATAAKKTTKRG